MKAKMHALRIALVYLLVGTLWIYLSDAHLGSRISDPELLTQFQTYKGWFYVLITTLLAYLLVNQALRRQSAAEASMRDSEARFHTIFDNVSDIILVREADTGQIVEANVKAVEQLGYSVEELRRLGFAELSANVPPYTEKEAMAWLALARQGGTPTFEWRAKRRDGSLLWLEVSLRQAEIGGRPHILSMARDITERKQAERKLEDEHSRLRSLVQTIPELVWMKDNDGVYLLCNPAFERFFGAWEVDIVGKTDYDFVDAELADSFRANDREAMIAGAPHTNDEWVTLAVGGQRVLLETTKAPVLDGHGQILGVLGISRDITEARAAQDALRQSEALLRQSQRIAALGHYVYDPVSNLWSSSEELDVIFGIDEHYPRSAEGWLALVHPSQREEMSSYLQEHILGGRNRFDKEYRIVRANDKAERWVHGLGDLEFDDTGQPVKLFGIIHDITERKAAQSRIEYLAYHDQLTGLPNRLLARDRFEQAAAHAERSGLKVAMLFLDMDHFKTINDVLGHSVGDAMLEEVASRLRLCVRDTDTVSRQGGDEFLISLTEVHDTDAVAFFSTKILEQLAQPFDIEGHKLSSSVSIGAVVYPDDGFDFDTLLKKADTAMYHAKESGRNACHFFDAKMNAEADEMLAMRTSLSMALERKEFVIHYQPQVDLASGALIGAEALLRWRHPELGMVSPVRFIPIAEDSGLIVPIGEWVLREACRQAAAWQQAGMRDFTIAVNLSAVQFKRNNLEQTVISALTDSGLEPPSLELELTESILIRDTENVLQTVQRLKLLGVKLSIDDFGTGYSSLAYLSRFAVDKVKIDQSFVRGLTSNTHDAAIVRAIIHMARSMGLRTIAEGVEEQRLYDYLRAHHCDEAQGYHIGRPMPAEEFAAHVAAHHPAQQVIQ